MRPRPAKLARCWTAADKDRLVSGACVPICCLQEVRAVARKQAHVSETPATQALRRAGVVFSEHVYDYLEHGGTAESARQLGVDEHAVVKTLVMQNEQGRAADRADARRPAGQHQEPGARDRQQERRAVHARRGASGHSGYQVGGTSPFATRKAMPVYVEATILELDRDLHQRRPARLPDRHRAGRPERAAPGHAGDVRAVNGAGAESLVPDNPRRR